MTGSCFRGCRGARALAWSVEVAIESSKKMSGVPKGDAVLEEFFARDAVHMVLLKEEGTPRVRVVAELAHPCQEMRSTVACLLL